MKKIFNMMMATAIALCTFTACEDVPMPFNNPLDYQEESEDTSIPPEGDGTFENPFNVSGVLQYINGLEPGVESDKDVYVKGVVLSVKEPYSTQYGNATFTMSDDDLGSNSFTFYRGLYFGNKKYSNSDDVNVNEGDKVVICGRVMNYGGSTPETSQGKAFVVTINDKTVHTDTTDAVPKGSGTQADPYNPAGAAAAVKNLTWTSNDTYDTTGDVYVKGKISRIADKGTFTDGGTYGNASFYISEDGTESGEFYCFRILYLGNKKFVSGQTDIKVGDEVIVCGQLMNYRGNTPETVAGKAYLYSLNGTTEGSGGGGGGGDDTVDAKKVTIAEFNAAEESNDVWYQLTGTVKNLKDGDQYGNFDLVDETGSVYVYGLLSEKGGEKKKFQDLVAAKGIKEGSKITIIGTRGSYNGKIEVMNAYFVSIEDGEGGGGSSDIKAITVADFNAAPESNDVWYQLTGKVKNLKDGDQYGNFDLEDSTGSVYVYGLLSEKGGAKKKFQDLVAAQGIANGSTITIIGTRGSYNGKIEVMNAYFVSIEK
ncbi:MAG: hypothetical protein K5893_00095 [Prevotella sp.]|nr:hypothetical protein [Prevotella sp.]